MDLARLQHRNQIALELEAEEQRLTSAAQREADQQYQQNDSNPDDPIHDPPQSLPQPAQRQTTRGRGHGHGLQPVVLRGHDPYHPPEPYYLGPMSIKCLHCGSLHFDIEKLSISTRNEPKFGMCCLQGQVRLAKLKHSPTELWNLFSESNPLSANFKKNI